MRDSPDAGRAKRFNVGDVMRPRIDHRLRRLPRLLARALTVVWRAAPRPFLVTGCLQVITGVGLAVQVLVAQRVLSRIIAGGDGGDFGDVLPSLVLLMAVGFVITLGRAVLGELRRVLSERVARYRRLTRVSGGCPYDLVRPRDLPREAGQHTDRRRRPSTVAVHCLGWRDRGAVRQPRHQARQLAQIVVAP